MIECIFLFSCNNKKNIKNNKEKEDKYMHYHECVFSDSTGNYRFYSYPLDTIDDKEISRVYLVRKIKNEK